MSPGIRSQSHVKDGASQRVAVRGSAAQYVRMSTDHQKYSIINQKAVIAAYAVANGLTVVRSYEDAGRSGLSAEGRQALLRLVDDVIKGNADFDTVLVYDVSRWGRFQDTDEAAYYEYVCRRGGVSVHYCAEQFENNGGLITAIVKGLKRAMAAEFSRELSVKVLAGQKRTAQLGFRHGGRPGYGLRRLLVDENGSAKTLLENGHAKHLHTDRVVLVPGPSEEVALVREIFDMFVEQHIGGTNIARHLNERGICNAWGKRWNTNSIFWLLKNRTYIGDIVFNRTTQHLLTKRRPNPRSEWIVKEGAYEPIVDRLVFERAQEILANSWTYTDADLLNYLTAMLCVHGTLSSKIIIERTVGPSITTYYHRFGTLAKAFAKIGFDYKAGVRVCDPLYRQRRKCHFGRSTRKDFAKFRYRLPASRPG